MSASEGLRIISVAKALEAFQRGDPHISQYFGATLLSGHAGLFLSSLRSHLKMKARKFRALAAAAHIEAPLLKTVVVPWLKEGAFIEGNPFDDTADIDCNVLDHDAVLSGTSGLFRSLDPTPEELAVMGIVDLGVQMPQLQSQILATKGLGDEQVITRATGLAKAYKIVNVLEGPGISEPVIYSPLIWGDNISKAGKALSHLNPDRRETLLALINMIRTYQGMPRVTAAHWVMQNGQPDLVDFAVGVGLLDQTQITSADGQTREFLTTPHIYGELAVTQGKDVCDRIRLFLDSIRHGEYFGDWYTGKITDPARLLSKLIDKHQIGPCTAIGRDYQLVEKAGIVNVKPSTSKSGQFVMELVQKDTVQLVRDIVIQKSPALSAAPARSGMCSQSDFVSSEATRAKIGDRPERIREAEHEMLRQLREL
jgi:hypothetical protein